MKKIYYFIAALGFLSMTACGDGLDFPDPGVETDLNKIPLPDVPPLVEIESKAPTVPMSHVGGLHTEEDFARIRKKIRNGESPWVEGWEMFKKSRHANLGDENNGDLQATEAIVRTSSGAGDNVMQASRAAAAAYQMAVRWKIGVDDNAQDYADAAIKILNNWASVNKRLGGDQHNALSGGLIGYQFAAAGELMRDYENWNPRDFADFQQWMLAVFYPSNSSFLSNYWGVNALHYWSNWPLCNLASMMAIGIVADRRDIYNEAIEHLQTGATNARLTRAICHVFTGKWANFAQLQESGRDQGHTIMVIGVLGEIMQLAYNQGDDFYKYNNNMFLKGCEYVAYYNYTSVQKEDVPYTTYVWQQQVGSEIRPTVCETLDSMGGGRGEIRPVWALPYYHYRCVKGIDADKCQYSKIAADRVAPEGGGSQYGPNTGGYDQLGIGTLMYAMDLPN